MISTTEWHALACVSMLLAYGCHCWLAQQCSPPRMPHPGEPIVKLVYWKNPPLPLSRQPFLARLESDDGVHHKIDHHHFDSTPIFVDKPFGDGRAAASQRRHYLCRRFGLWRSGLLWASDDRYTSFGSDGPGRSALDPVLLGRAGLHAQPRGPADRTATDPQRHVQPSASRAVPTFRRWVAPERDHPGRSAEGRWLCDGMRGQVAPGTPIGVSAHEARFRRVLRPALLERHAQSEGASERARRQGEP